MRGVLEIPRTVYLILCSRDSRLRKKLEPKPYSGISSPIHLSEQRYHGPIVTYNRIDVGLDLFTFIYLPPVDLVVGIDDEVLKKQALGPVVALAEWVDDIQIAIEFGNAGDKVYPILSFKPVCLRQGVEQLVGFRLDSMKAAKAGPALGDINGANVASPLVEVLEYLAVDLLEIVEAVGREGKFDFTGGEGCNLALRAG